MILCSSPSYTHLFLSIHSNTKVPRALSHCGFNAQCIIYCSSCCLFIDPWPPERANWHPSCWWCSVSKGHLSEFLINFNFYDWTVMPSREAFNTKSICISKIHRPGHFRYPLAKQLGPNRETERSEFISPPLHSDRTNKNVSGVSVSQDNYPAVTALKSNCESFVIYLWVIRLDSVRFAEWILRMLSSKFPGANPLRSTLLPGPRFIAQQLQWTVQQLV